MRLASTHAGDRREAPSALPLILRVGVSLCFLGHGAFGLLTKKAWLDYFAVVGIGETWGWKLMPLIGAMDVTIAFLALVWPCRALFVWAVVWTTATALMRPLAHQGWPEFFERAGNYGVPLAIVVAIGLRGPWFSRLSDLGRNWSDAILERVSLTLRVALATLLVGHSFCALLLKKPALAHLYEALGVSSPSATMIGVGWFELVLAVSVVLIRSPLLFTFVCIWKLGTELLFLSSGAQVPVFEVIERGGSYIIPLALAYLSTRGRTGDRFSAQRVA